MIKHIIRASFILAAMTGTAVQLQAVGITRTWTGSWDPSAPTTATTDDDIVISSGGNLAWDASLPATVVSWTQADTYTGTVTIHTVYGASAFTNLTITGDALIAGGAWTHVTNTTADANRLCVTINGNLTLTNTASIHGSNSHYGLGQPEGRVEELIFQ